MGAFIPCAPPRTFVMSIAASSSSPVRGGSTCPGLHVFFVCTVSLDASGMLSVKQKQSDTLPAPWHSGSTGDGPTQRVFKSDVTDVSNRFR